MVHDEGGVDRHADMICQRRIDIGLLEGVEFPVLDIAQTGREALADQGKQRKDMVTEPPVSVNNSSISRIVS